MDTPDGEDYITARVAKESVQAVLRTSDQLIVGRIHARPEKRLKDELNVAKERFIAVTQARVYDASGARLLYQASFMLLANEHVVSVTPLDALEASPSDAPWLKELAKAPETS